MSSFFGSVSSMSSETSSSNYKLYIPSSHNLSNIGVKCARPFIGEVGNLFEGPAFCLYRPLDIMPNVRFLYHFALPIEHDEKGRITEVIEYTGPDKSNSIVKKSTFTEFIGKHPIVYLRIYQDNPKEVYSHIEAIARAKSLLGENEYFPFTNNCEHLIKKCALRNPEKYEDQASTIIPREK